MENERTAGEIINLGNPTEYTINEVAQLIIKLTGTTSKIVFHPLPIDDPKKRRPDISKAERLLNWRPHIDLEEGLKRTISHYRASMNEREII
jgi:nucleoside-diphosphate-sugar epimerase